VGIGARIFAETGVARQSACFARLTPRAPRPCSRRADCSITVAPGNRCHFRARRHGKQPVSVSGRWIRRFSGMGRQPGALRFQPTALSSGIHRARAVRRTGLRGYPGPPENHPRKHRPWPYLGLTTWAVGWTCPGTGSRSRVPQALRGSSKYPIRDVGLRPQNRLRGSWSAQPAAFLRLRG